MRSCVSLCSSVLSICLHWGPPVTDIQWSVPVLPDRDNLKNAARDGIAISAIETSVMNLIFSAISSRRWLTRILVGVISCQGVNRIRLLRKVMILQNLTLSATLQRWLSQLMRPGIFVGVRSCSWFGWFCSFPDVFLMVSYNLQLANCQLNLKRYCSR